MMKVHAFTAGIGWAVEKRSGCAAWIFKAGAAFPSKKVHGLVTLFGPISESVGRSLLRSSLELLRSTTNEKQSRTPALTEASSEKFQITLSTIR
jgi:hypothetical protein